VEKRTMRQWIHFTLTVVTSLYVVTGIGISDPRLMESLSLGLLTKERSLWIHGNLLQLFAILLFLHIYFKVRPTLQRNASIQLK
jgi:thiosulfate reductase cytochrome b subunit